jgi:signal transduction protein with GAF and PtsI domain
VLSEPLSEQETVDAVAQAAAEALGGACAAVLRADVGGLELLGSFRLDPKLAEALDAHDASLVVAQLELAGQVAAAARGALERSDLYERERRSRSLAQRLARAGRELAGELDPDDVLDAATRHALDLLAADGASVRVLEGDEVVVRAAAGAGSADVLGTRAPSTGWLVGDVVQTRSPRATEDVGDDSRYAAADEMLAAGYAGYLGVPMIGPDDAAQGILAVYSRRPRRWRE